MGILYYSPELESFKDESNYIYKVAQEVAQKFNVTLPCLQIEMRSDIPLARGLGSSASALVGALYIANYFGNIQLSQYELLQLATEIEGHLIMWRLRFTVDLYLVITILILKLQMWHALMYQKLTLL